MGRIYDATWGRLFAAMYDRGLKGTEEAGLREMRRATLAEASGRTIDVGAGTGANLGLYPAAVSDLVLSEPDPHMAAKLRPKLAASGAAAEVVDAPAESLPFEDSSFDTVVFTLVLCTVPDPAAALARPRGCCARAASCSSSSTSAPRTRAWPAGRIASKAPGASSLTAATATATPSRRSKPRRSAWST